MNLAEFSQLLQGVNSSLAADLMEWAYTNRVEPDDPVWAILQLQMLGNGFFVDQLIRLDERHEYLRDLVTDRALQLEQHAVNWQQDLQQRMDRQVKALFDYANTTANATLVKVGSEVTGLNQAIQRSTQQLREQAQQLEQQRLAAQSVPPPRAPTLGKPLLVAAVVGFLCSGLILSVGPAYQQWQNALDFSAQQCDMGKKFSEIYPQLPPEQRKLVSGWLARYTDRPSE